MNEQEYIELQKLLAKLRVECLKEAGNIETDSSVREKLFKIIRNVDNIRKFMPLKIDQKLYFYNK